MNEKRVREIIWEEAAYAEKDLYIKGLKDKIRNVTGVIDEGDRAYLLSALCVAWQYNREIVVQKAERALVALRQEQTKASS